MTYYKSKTQPLCRCCGRPIKKYATTVYVKDDLTKVEWGKSGLGCRQIDVPARLLSKQDCQRHSNQIVISVDYTIDYKDDEPDQSTRRIHHFNEWDGETYVDQFFCTGTCAQRFGRLAADRTKLWTQAYADAIAKQRRDAA